jgi:hypothetical protein
VARQSEMMRLRLSLLVPNRIEQEVDKNILGHLALHVQYAHLYIHTFHFPLVTINILNFTALQDNFVLVCAVALSYKSSAEHSNV